MSFVYIMYVVSSIEKGIYYIFIYMHVIVSLSIKKKKIDRVACCITSTFSWLLAKDQVVASCQVAFSISLNLGNLGYLF